MTAGWRAYAGAALDRLGAALPRARQRRDRSGRRSTGCAVAITVDGVDYAEIEATLDRVQGANSWLTMGLREGKNREIKRVLEHLGLEVNRLIRLSFGPFQLGESAEGALEEVKTRVLRDQLGPVLAEAAGVDFYGAAAVSEAPGGGRAAGPARAPRATARRAPVRGKATRGRQTARKTRARRARAGPTPPARAFVSSVGASGRDPQKTGAGAAQAYFGAAQRGGGTGGRAQADAAQRDGRPQRARRPGRAAGRRAAGERAKGHAAGPRGGAAREPQRAPLRGRAQAARRRSRTADARPRPGRFRRGAPARAGAAAAGVPNPESSRSSNARPKASREARRGASGAKRRAKAAAKAQEARARRSRAGLMTPPRTGRGRSCGAARTPGQSGSTRPPARPERRAGAPRAQSATARGRESRAGRNPPDAASRPRARGRPAPPPAFAARIRLPAAKAGRAADRAAGRAAGRAASQEAPQVGLREARRGADRAADLAAARQRAPARKILSHAHRRRAAQGARAERPGLGFDPADVGSPAREPLQHSRPRL